MNGLGAHKGHNRTTGAGVMIAQSVADILGQHVKLSVEGIDRMYLNVYVPRLQIVQGVVGFFREHRGQPLPSAALRMTFGRISRLRFSGCHGTAAAFHACSYRTIVLVIRLYRLRRSRCPASSQLH